MIDLANKEQVINRLDELKQQQLPHMTIDIMSTIAPNFKSMVEGCTEEEKNIINKELFPFLGQKLNYCIIAEESPILNWGLAHGVSVDSNTGLSWKTYHYFNINGKERRFEYTLQYHPDVYTIEN